MIFRDIAQQIRDRGWERRKAEIFASIIARSTVEITLTHIAEALAQLCEGCAVAVLAREGDFLHLRGEAGLPSGLRSNILAISLAEATQLCGKVVLQRTAMTDARVFTDSHGTKSTIRLQEWSVPLRTPGGEILGALSLFGQIAAQPAQLGSITSEAAELACLALEHSRLQQELTHQAQHDSLTGLPNRMLLEDRLEQAILVAERHGTHLGVCYIDLDRFKQINDTLGHGVGDKFLQRVAASLRLNCRSGDTLARQGGDEFILVLPNLKSSDEAQKIAELMLQKLRVPFLVDDKEFAASACFGISMYPSHGDSPQTLLQHADTALYAAKRAGRNQVRMFHPKLGLEVQQHTRLQTGLQEAMTKNHLSLMYQPIYSPERELHGLEVLLRWTDPVHGEIPPSSFVPIAEESGLIVPIGAWVLENACRQVASWKEAGLSTPRIYVNVSGVQLNREDFPAMVASSLERNRLPGSSLGLEITETWIVSDPDAAAMRLHSLRELGVTISVDDFGTGQSSLGCLHQLPLDTLKIDRSFISRLDQSGRHLPTVRAIVQLAQQLGLRTVAEGVETEVQFEQLRTSPVIHCRGFY